MKNFNQLVSEYNEIKGRLTTLSIKKIELMDLSSDTENDNYLSSILKNRYTDIDSQQSRLEQELDKLSRKIINKVDAINNVDAKNIILMRIFTNKTWKFIAKSCFYSEARVRQLYKKGLTMLTQE